MDLVKRAKLIEDTELELAKFVRDKRKAGLDCHSLLRILMLQLQDTLIQFETECILQAKTQHNQKIRPSQSP